MNPDFNKDPLKNILKEKFCAVAKIELREAQTPNLSESKKSKTTQLRRICFAIIFVSLFSSHISRYNCYNGLCPKNIVQEAPSLKTSQIRKE